MSTIEEVEGAKAELRQNLEKLQEYSVDSLCRSDLGVDLNFEQGRPYFERTLRLFNDLGECSLDGVPVTVLNQLRDQAQQTAARFEIIRNFSIRSYPQNAIQQRDALMKQVKDSYDPTFSVVAPQISFATRKGTDFREIEIQARDVLASVHATKEDLANLNASLAKESNEILGSMRRAAAEVGVSQHMVHFKMEAEEQAKKGGPWLKWTIVLSLVTLCFAGFAVWYYTGHASDLTPVQSVQVGVAKLAVLSVLYFGIILCSRIYRAHRHLEAVNRHRQNALGTFEAFIKAASDAQTKDAVLLYAAQAVFSPQATGYFGKETEQPASPQILEVIRGFSAKEQH